MIPPAEGRRVATLGEFLQVQPNSRRFDHLDDFTNQKAQAICEDFATRPLITPTGEEIAHHATLLCYCTFRPLTRQACVFRITRNYSQIAAKMKSLERRGFPMLAQVLHQVGPQGTAEDLKRANLTNAGPGESWHVYGRAFDAVPMLHGQLIWDRKSPLWVLYGQVVSDHGLTWAGGWPSFQEYPHAQASHYANALDDPAYHAWIVNRAQTVLGNHRDDEDPHYDLQGPQRPEQGSVRSETDAPDRDGEPA